MRIMQASLVPLFLQSKRTGKPPCTTKPDANDAAAAPQSHRPRCVGSRVSTSLR